MSNAAVYIFAWVVSPIRILSRSLITKNEIDPVVAVHDVKTGELLNAAYLAFNRRASVDDDLKTQFKIPYYKGEGQVLKVSVFANDDEQGEEEPKMLEQDRMGSARVDVDDLVGHLEKGRKFPLEGAQLVTESDKDPHVLLVCLVPDEAAQEKVLPIVNVLFCMCCCWCCYCCLQWV